VAQPLLRSSEVLPDSLHDLPLRSRIITHGNAKEEHTEIRKGCEQACRERDEKAEEGNAAKWARWKGRQGEEQEAGDRDWIVGSAQEGSEGAIEAEVERWAQEDGWSEKVGIEAEVIE
jgi:hypothetical protein